MIHPPFFFFILYFILEIKMLSNGELYVVELARHDVDQGEEKCAKKNIFIFFISVGAFDF